MNASVERYAILSIAKRLRDAFPAVTVQVRGARTAVVNRTEEEWLALDVLSMDRRPARVTTWFGEILFQVTCFARFAANRTDAQTDAPWTLAAQVQRELEGDNLPVQDLDAASPATFAHLKVLPGDSRYLSRQDENMHAVVLTYRGVLVDTT